MASFVKIGKIICNLDNVSHMTRDDDGHLNVFTLDQSSGFYLDGADADKFEAWVMLRAIDLDLGLEPPDSESTPETPPVDPLSRENL